MVGADVPGGPPPARGAAGRPTTEPRVGVGCRRARGARVPTNVGVLMCQGQPTWEARADATRRGRRGYFARRTVAGRLWIWPWVGCWSRAAQGPAATSAALPCGRGSRGRAISRRNSSEVKSCVPKPAARRRAKYPRRPRRVVSKQARRRARPRQARPSRVAEVQETRDFTSEQFRSEIPHPQTSCAAAREVPAPPSARDVQAGPAQGPAATSAALPCRRGAGDAGFHFGTVPPGRYTARRRAKYPRRPRRGTSKRARRRARPRQARPSRVAEGVGDAGFHVGTVPPGRYAARRRAKYPRRPRHGTSKRARRRARPRQARPSRVAEGLGDARFHVGTVPK